MAESNSTEFMIPDENLWRKIYFIRERKIIIDSDLAEMYGVATKRINEAVKRNSERFPDDFMFQLSQDEWNNLKSQIATSSWGGRRILPYAFTEHGILMLSSVLKSERAVQVNIRIMRVFILMKELINGNEKLLSKIQKIEMEMAEQGENIQLVFDYLEQFVQKKKKSRNRIGFKTKSNNQ